MRTTISILSSVALCGLLTIPGLSADNEPGAISGKTGSAPALRAPDTVGPAIKSRSALSVNGKSRAAVVAFYRQNYVPHNRVPNGWQGNARLCRDGKNSAAYDSATLKNLRYYRAMAGVPADVSFAEKYSQHARAAALMMEAKGDLSHGPGRDWPCYTASGKQGAASSNLCLGCVGPSAIDAYVRDSGVKGVGHRVWALHPRQKVLGNGSSKRAHALYVFGDWRPDEEVAHIKSVAWPPAGYVPFNQGLDARYPWSYTAFGQGKQNYDRAKVEMRWGPNFKKTIRVRQERGNNGILVWYPEGLPRAEYRNQYNRPEKDTPVRVKIRGITMDGKKQAIEYTVRFIDPDAKPSENESDDSLNSEDSDSTTDSLSAEERAKLNRGLLYGSYAGQTDRVQALLKNGADPNAKHSSGWSALMYAAYYGHAKIVRALDKAGADRSYAKQKWTAARLAEARGHTKIAEYLKRGQPAHRGLAPAPTETPRTPLLAPPGIGN